MKLKTLLAAALVAACATAQAATLKWGAQNDILTLDPHSQNHATTHGILQHTYEGLVRYNKDFQVEPCLATSWQMISPTQVRFNLRKNVKFHDGTPFTADDVVFSYGRIIQPQGTNQIYVSGVKEVRKIDDHTVDLILGGPNPVLLRLLVDFRIMSKAWSTKHKSENVQDYVKKEESYASRNANGTGPYMIKMWEPDKRIVFAANPGWWDKLQGNATEVIYTPIKADATRIAALLSGDVDLVTDLPTQDVQRLRGDPKLKVLDGHEVRTIFIGMDQFSPELKYSSVKGKNPFKDARVRKALNLAVDREAIRRVTMRGLAIPAAIMVAPGVHGHTPDIDKVAPADADGARKLLAEAGYPNGFEFGLDCPNNRYVNDEEICQALVGMWGRIGLKV
jgi:peptide/nickel transport system substrate-binding protein